MVNVVGASARDDLLEAQELTLRSMEAALQMTSADAEVTVVGVRFPDEELPRSWMTDGVPLTRSILDLGDFDPPRRLPLLADILASLDDEDFDLAIFTNIDIALQPHFYDLVVELHRMGYDAFSINRRTVQPMHDGSSLALLAAQTGSAHPGHDCFVFDARVARAIDVGEVAVGVPLVARALLFNVLLAARSFRQFVDLNATFHVGDDRQWTAPRFNAYSDHNHAALLEVMRRLAGEHGTDAVMALPEGKGFLHRARQPTPPTWAPRRLDPGVVFTPRSVNRRRLILAASPGRSGTEFLARLLGTAAGVTSHHEAEPTMAGRHLRSVAYGSSASSYRERMEKAHALEDELDSLAPGNVLVDTTHMFLKTFADVVVDRINHDRIAIVELHRPIAGLVSSMIELGWFTPFAPAWPDWLIPPTAPGSRFPIEPSKIEGRLDLAIGYVLDSAIRARELRAAYPGLTWVETSVAELRTRDDVERLFGALGLRSTPATWEIAFTGVNQRTSLKLGRRVGLGPDAVAAGLASFARRFSDQIRSAGVEYIFEATVS